MTVLLLSEQVEAAVKELREKLLAHVARYKITLVHVVKRLFFPVYIEPDHKKAYAKAKALLDSLVAEGELETIKGRSDFAKNVYLLPGHNIKEEADLSRLWFCCMNRERGYLTRFAEIRPIFEAEEDTKAPFHNFSVAIVDTPGGPVLMRLYLCLAEKKNAREMLVQSIGQKAKAFRDWVDSGTYGVAVLVHAEQKKKEIENLLSVSHAGKPPLNQLGRFIVETVPTLATFPAALKQHEKELWK